MKRIWLLAVLVAVVGFAIYAGNVFATQSQGFTGSTVAKATFGNVFSHVQTHEPQFWNEIIKTEGASDLYVQQNTWDPSLCGGCMPGTGTGSSLRMSSYSVGVSIAENSNCIMSR